MGEINPNLDYGYIPTAWLSILFTILFAASTSVHVYQGIRFRTWWVFPTIVLAGGGEIAGWAGRYWSSRTPLGNGNAPFSLQIIATILAPTPLLAANFIIVGRLITRLGPQYSRLSSRKYTRIFLSADIICLIIQALGAATASSESTSNPPGNPAIGGFIMLGGIAAQLVAIIVFALVASEFIWRYRHDQPHHSREMQASRGTIDKGVNRLIIGLRISTIFLAVRAIYRVVELSFGFNGPVLRTQWYFVVFDGLMVLFAIVTINVLHPGYLLRNEKWATIAETNNNYSVTGNNSYRLNHTNV